MYLSIKRILWLFKCKNNKEEKQKDVRVGVLEQTQLDTARVCF
jgi:hypothetical protein